LPKNWDPNKAYPMFLELHGAGNPAPLDWPALQVGSDGATLPDLRGYEAPKTYVMMQREGFHIFPSARGNTFYHDIGETDVWEAYNDASRTFKIDPDRRYLYGFSMGGGGAWRLGSRTSDLWAAIGIFSPGGGLSSTNVGRNVTNVPIHIWCGQDDSLLREAEAIRDQITKYGPPPVFETRPNTGHQYLEEAQVTTINWMEQFTRKRPSKFSFICDTDEHRGIWGVNMTRDLSMSGTPSFDCAIDGQTVTITSVGAPSLTVDLGINGLGMAGDVTLIWNGQKVYEGQPNVVRLPVIQ
jgi:predicted esterase